MRPDVFQRGGRSGACSCRIRRLLHSCGEVLWSVTQEEIVIRSQKTLGAYIRRNDRYAVPHRFNDLSLHAGAEAKGAR